VNIQRIAGIVLYNPKNDSILFQLRDNKPKINEPNLWVLPGGGIDENESLVDGVTREIKEETNYKLFNPFYFFGFSFGFQGVTKEMFFFYEIYEGKRTIECNEGQEMRFQTRKEFQKLEKPWYLDIVLNHFSKKFNSFK